MNEWDGNVNFRNQRGKNPLLIIGIVFTIVGLTFMIVGMIMLINAKKKTDACTGEAKATVIMLDEAYSEDEDGHKSKVYAPVVEYTVGDETYTEMSPVHRSPCKFTVGQTVMVHYDPSDPHVMIIEGDDGTKFLYILFMGMGGFFALIGLVFDISGVRSKREVL